MRQLHAITPAEGKIERLSNFLKVKDRKIWLPGLYRGRAHFSLASLWLIGKALISTISLQMLLDYLNSRDLICVSKISRLLEEGSVLAFHSLFMSTSRDMVKRRVVRSKKRLLGKIGFDTNWFSKYQQSLNDLEELQLQPGPKKLDTRKKRKNSRRKRKNLELKPDLYLSKWSSLTKNKILF